MIEILLDPFRYDFMIRSLITAFASGAMLSLLGPFTINRNMGFMADAMAHATLPIIAVGVFLGFSISELGVPAAILIAIFLGLIIKNTNVGEDTAIGIIFSSFFALGFVLISLLNVTVNLEDLLFGQILAVNISDVYIVVSLLILVILVTVIYFKQLLFYSFDPIGAEVKGLNTTFLNYLFLIGLSHVLQKMIHYSCGQFYKVLLLILNSFHQSRQVKIHFQKHYNADYRHLNDQNKLF